jgi:hypothetical protein
MKTKNSQKLIKTLIFSNLFLMSLVVFFLITSFNSQVEDFDEITAKRINILNEDGTIVMAISNKQKIAAPRIDGVEYPVEMIERQHFAGIIFFNESGDEMGGLIYNSGKDKKGRVYGSGHLSFDKYNDNQVVNLEYKENIHGTVKSGLSIYDRKSDGSFPKSLELTREYFYDDISEERKNEIKSTLNKMKADKKLGSERIFIGSNNTVPQLVLKDTKGNERLKIFIDSLDVARIQFLDKSGNIKKDVFE